MALTQLNQSVTSIADLVTKLDTFLSTAGGGNPAWSSDESSGTGPDLTFGRWALSKDEPGGDTVEVAFQWDAPGSPTVLGIYQYHTTLAEGAGYNSGTGTVPFDQVGDSGVGAASAAEASLLLARHAAVGAAPVKYWCFAGTTHAHIVVKLANLVDYVHFGFGYATKTNDWTGGEYAYGMKYTGNPMNALSTHLWDGLINGTNMELFAATMHVEGMSDSPTGGLWGSLMGPQGAAALGTDRQAAPKKRVHMRGGFRGSSHAAYFGGFAGTTLQGFVPTYPIIAYHYDRDIDAGGGPLLASITPPMAIMPDVRGIHMKSFSPEDTITIGGDTWHIFPSRRFSTTSTSSTSGVQGIMYKAN